MTLRCVLLAAACMCAVPATTAETGCKTLDGTACLDTFTVKGQTNTDGWCNDGLGIDWVPGVCARPTLCHSL